ITAGVFEAAQPSAPTKAVVTEQTARTESDSTAMGTTDLVNEPKYPRSARGKFGRSSYVRGATFLLATAFWIRVGLVSSIAYNTPGCVSRHQGRNLFDRLAGQP